jgi:hypothetical protein
LDTQMKSIDMPTSSGFTMTGEAGIASLCAAWAFALDALEVPAPFSVRDGAYGLRIVPRNERINLKDLEQAISGLLESHPQLLGALLQPYPQSTPRLPRHRAAAVRGWAYLKAKNPHQALRDAAAASAFASTRLFGNHASLRHTSCDAHAQSPSWAPAALLQGEAHAALESWTEAVLAMARCEAAARSPTAPAADRPLAKLAATRIGVLIRRLPPAHALAWASGGGFQGLKAQVELEAELAIPEVLRPRPRWFYYNTWMTQRIHNALLELHLGEPLTSGAGINSAQAVLGAADVAMAHTPLLAAAAAAAGFLPTGGGNHSAAAAAAANQPDINSMADSGSSHAAPVSNQTGSGGLGVLSNGGTSGDGGADGGVPLLLGSTATTLAVIVATDSEGGAQADVLRLPAPVLDRLLQLDAGDLDLLVQHPTALQAQVCACYLTLQAVFPLNKQL